MTDLGTFATVGQLVNTAVSAARTISEFAKDSSDTTLKGEISSLYNALHEIQVMVMALHQENHSLKAQLAAKGEIEGPISPHGYFRYKDRPDNPLCPKCLQGKDERPVFLPEVHQFNIGTGRKCIVCGYLKIEDDSKRPPQPQISTPYSDWG